jgi:hypothetical protein
MMMTIMKQVRVISKAELAALPGPGQYASALRREFYATEIMRAVDCETAVQQAFISYGTAVLRYILFQMTAQYRLCGLYYVASAAILPL